MPPFLDTVVCTSALNHNCVNCVSGFTLHKASVYSCVSWHWVSLIPRLSAHQEPGKGVALSALCACANWDRLQCYTINHVVRRRNDGSPSGLTVSLVSRQTPASSERHPLGNIYIFGASLSEPHTSVTSLRTRVCIYLCLLACLLACLDRPLTGYFK